MKKEPFEWPEAFGTGIGCVLGIITGLGITALIIWGCIQVFSP